jgi:hypothetical protein
MNIAQIRVAAQKLIDGTQAAIERIEDKDSPTERDEDRLAALEEFLDAVETAIGELDSVYED